VIRRVFVFYEPTDPAEEDLNRPIENLIPIATKS